MEEERLLILLRYCIKLLKFLNIIEKYGSKQTKKELFELLNIRQALSLSLKNKFQLSGQA